MQIIRTRFFNGQFDLNKITVSSQEKNVMIFFKPTNRASWDPTGKEGYYIEPSNDQYRCVKCYIYITREELNYDTV